MHVHVHVHISTHETRPSDTYCLRIGLARDARGPRRDPIEVATAAQIALKFFKMSVEILALLATALATDPSTTLPPCDGFL